MENRQQAELDAAIVARVMVAKFKATGNPIFLWEAIRDLTPPELDGEPVTLPSELRAYLHAAAQAVVSAALRLPGEFGKETLRALDFADGVQGSSRPKEWAKLQSSELLLSIYEDAKRRKGSYAGALQFMEEALSISRGAIDARLTEARRFDAELRGALGMLPRGLNPSPSSLTHMPEIVLTTMLKGIPDIFWKQPEIRAARIPNKVGRTPKGSPTK